VKVKFERRKLTPDEFLYPSTDNRPMAESDRHRKLMVDVIDRLSVRYSGRPDVYVSGNRLVYYIENNPYHVLAPDCFVAFGVPPGDRDIYKSWEEGRLPTVVFEFTSSSTRQEDQYGKFDIYQDEWQVEEYFLFDPRGDYLIPPLIGYRRSRGKLRPIRPAGSRVHSRSLGIDLEPAGGRLVLFDAATGVELPRSGEAERRLLAAERDAAQAELAAMKAELAALKKQKP
jgi:Uma2 family endonuclease